MSKKVAAAVKPQGTINLLGIHGHAMTGPMFEKKIGSIRSEVKKMNCAFHFPTGPIVSPPDWFAGGPTTTTTTAPSSSNIPPVAETTPSKSDEKTAAPPDGEVAVATTTPSPPAAIPKSWMDFWTARKAEADAADNNTGDAPSVVNVSDPKSIFPYIGVPESLRLLASYTKNLGDESSNSAPLLDGHFAFSQGTCISVIWLAIAMRQIRLEVEAVLAGGVDGGKGVGESAPEEVVAAEDLPLESWRLPQHMLLLKQPVVNNSATSTPNNFAAKPFLFILGSGLVPRDDMFGAFVKSEALQYGKLLQHLQELENGTTTIVSTNGSFNLRPIVSLHCFGSTDDLIKPVMSQGLIDLFRTIESGANIISSEQSSSSPTTAATYDISSVAGAQAVSVWSHDGGHVMPAPFRKPFKQFIQSVAAHF